MLALSRAIFALGALLVLLGPVALFFTIRPADAAVSFADLGVALLPVLGMALAFVAGLARPIEEPRP